MLPNYLLKNVNRIKNLPTQKLGSWSSAYDGIIFDEFPVMQRLREKFPQKTIHRADVISLFGSGDLYLAFVAAMVWGGISASRPNIKSDKKTTNLYLALSHPEEKVIKAIKHAENCFLQNDFITPFKDMTRKGEHYIPCIGLSYFTKIFFFIGQSNPNIIVKPLVFDKWTSNAFYALLSETYPEDRTKYFTGINLKPEIEKLGTVALRSGSKLCVAYERYCALMNSWSIAPEISVTPDRLEQFVFGSSLKSRGQRNNPRIELWEIITSNQ
ncbi:hypothetical protein CXF83_15090 [Shewanella sp. Choline-02u-19]|nr:hypothetical protein CXF84_01330 [Shewanella sp. Bg11-22]PKI27942.1 hypothetical protein CXF83_15090 [Shewanella sp. Choline-02u-19]